MLRRSVEPTSESDRLPSSCKSVAKCQKLTSADAATYVCRSSRRAEAFSFSRKVPARLRPAPAAIAQIVMPITSRLRAMWNFLEQGERDGPAAPDPPEPSPNTPSPIGKIWPRFGGVLFCDETQKPPPGGGGLVSAQAGDFDVLRTLCSPSVRMIPPQTEDCQPG